MPETTLAEYQELDLPVEEVVAGRVGFVHDLFMAYDYELVDDLPSDAGDVVVLVGRNLRGDKIERLASHPGRVVFVSAPGDAGFRATHVPGRRALPPNFVAAFVTNNELGDGRVVNVPLGVRSNKVRHLKFVARNASEPRDGLLYGNFALTQDHYRSARDGRPHIRHRLAERFADEPWATLDVSDAPRSGYGDLVRYYASMRRHRFVLSPEGNGADCYRHWEALYLGAIPIVMAGPTMSSFADLPVLFTNDYSELSEEYLEEQWRRLSAQRFEIDGLLKSHYRRRFLAAVSRLSKPRFLCWGFRGSDQQKFVDLLEDPYRSPFPNSILLPRAPFVKPRSTSDPGVWQAIGGAVLEAADPGLRVAPGNGGSSAARQLLNTMPGARFVVTGEVEVAEGVKGAAVALLDGKDAAELAAQPLPGPGLHRFELEIEAPSARALIELRPGNGRRGGHLVIRELAVTAAP